MFKRWFGVLCIVVGLLVSSGCALFLIGAGGAGGYMLHKGQQEGGDGSKSGSASSKQGTSATQSKPATKSTSSSKSTTSD